MNRKIIVSMGIFVLTMACFTGCGTNKDQEVTGGPVQESQEQEAANEQENQTGIANPWVDITEEEANELCARLFKAPEGAKVQSWSKCESLGDPEKGVGPLVQLNFELDDMEFTARAQQGAAEDADISGIYAEWAAGPDDVTLANWGGGNMAGKVSRSIDDLGYTDLITWYDIEIGIKYSLCVTAADLDGFDIQAVAEQMYSADNEPSFE